VNAPTLADPDVRDATTNRGTGHAAAASAGARFARSIDSRAADRISCTRCSCVPRWGGGVPLPGGMLKTAGRRAGQALSRDLRVMDDVALRARAVEKRHSGAAAGASHGAIGNRGVGQSGLKTGAVLSSTGGGTARLGPCGGQGEGLGSAMTPHGRVTWAELEVYDRRLRAAGSEAETDAVIRVHLSRQEDTVADIEFLRGSGGVWGLYADSTVMARE